jgi:AcrR family transcriptional regulator
MSTHRKRGRPQAVEPAEILERAVMLFCTEGVDTLSLNQICVQLGISKPALYRSFGSEDGLRRAALAHFFTAWLAPRFALMDFTQPFAAQCEQLADLVTDTDPETPIAKGCLFTKMRLVRDILGSESLEMVQDLEYGLKAKLFVWMEGIVQSGQMKKDLSAAKAADYVDAQVMLAAIHLSQGGTPDEMKTRLLLALSALQT